MRRKIEDMKIDNKTLKLVRDIPKFESEYSKEKDKFNHKAYADTILRIIKDNEAPLVIGLLGPWGAGKSTILNLLMQSLKENKNYKFVYFNAWKYSDDSFRRQFIIECVDSLIEEKKKREKIKSKFKQRFLREIKKEVFSWKDLFKIIKTDISTAIRLSVSLFIVILVLIIGIYLKNHLLSLSSILMAVIIFILTEQIPKLIQFNIPIDPQLVLPEQFEDEFEKLIKKIKNKNIVFIIDDIDRCPARMIMDILDSVKNFLAPSSRNVNNNIYNKCYFIIAMDNNAVTSILKKERGEEYEKEEVLKFFDTTVRLSPLRIGDLIEFSKFVAKETNISEEVIQVAIYGGFDTPRKIKHFLNSFNVVYHIAKERYKEGTFPFEPQKISSIIAKVLILQLVFPYEFEKLVEDISLLEKWEKEAEKIFKGNQGVDKTNEKDFSYKNLLKFLWATKDIRITDIDAFLHFKLPAYATKLPDFSLFKNAIVENDIAQIKELMKEIETFQQKDALIELLRDILEIHPTDIFLSNILQSAITIYKLLDLPHQLNENFSNLLIRHILRAENILSFDPEIVFELLEYVKEKAKWTDDIINLSIQNINEGTNPVNISKFIKILYEKEYII
ncbi:KAP family NTPase [Candidatus Aminicenantes bacterium AC-708-M15]|jgi:Cdc6-like AAA superfamily ATPase|nr:KAP family NTPase [SCandidatus Aminicenantes bacterium Aminicenantia_JdfR_composite]MCP2603904.1 KAP family NTPase [Candidatus Aminicenantes bacterium AC-708-M15]MCP2605716.1 KAP family NTPase [Candidatus Aminicenantes bacterium AC-335-O07]MCP2618101.1 KAP family NTPase [Candidatus Aminicenantes bacterium AC-335-A11]